MTVGEIEASWIASHTKKGDKIVIINGSPTDDNAHSSTQGIHKVFDPLFKSKARIKVAEQWTPGWDPPTAQREMEQILTKANNDVDGGRLGERRHGRRHHRRSQGPGPRGQGADDRPGRLARGDPERHPQGYQGVTAFKDFRLQAPAAAKIAAAILKGKKPSGINGTIKNGQQERAGRVPAGRSDRQARTSRCSSRTAGSRASTAASRRSARVCRR